MQQITVKLCNVCGKPFKTKGMLTSGVVIIDDNARTHSAGVTKRLLDGFQWDIFDHSVYSPDLVPRDFHLFLELKKRLEEQCFRTGKGFEDVVNTHLEALAATFCGEGIGKLVHRYDKCLILNGDYVEK